MIPLMRLFWPLTFLISLVCASNSLSIYKDSNKYRYHGCYNETTQIAGSAETRALGGGINESKPGVMTIPMCLAFCGNGDTEYRYAGLEWSRECWCSQMLSGIAAKLDDSACDFPCEGNETTACGGSLKLSVYRVSAASGLAASKLMISFGVVLAFLLS